MCLYFKLFVPLHCIYPISALELGKTEKWPKTFSILKLYRDLCKAFIKCKYSNLELQNKTVLLYIIGYVDLKYCKKYKICRGKKLNKQTVGTLYLRGTEYNLFKNQQKKKLLVFYRIG